MVIDIAQKPYRDAERILIQQAKESADLVEVDSFSFFNGKESYASLLGKNRKHQKIAILKPKDDSKLYVYQLDKGVSQKQAQETVLSAGAEKIDKTTFGMLDGRPIWEIKSGTTYYIVDFETGKLSDEEGL